MGQQTVSASDKMKENAEEKMNGCVKADHYLTDFIDDAIDDFEKAAGSRKIKNIRAYMKSVIWTSLSSYKVKLDAELKHDLGI